MQKLHPKVKAVGQAGILVSAIVAALAAFGIAIPVAAVAPITTILVVVAGYAKSSGYFGS